MVFEKDHHDVCFERYLIESAKGAAYGFAALAVATAAFKWRRPDLWRRCSPSLRWAPLTMGVLGGATYMGEEDSHICGKEQRALKKHERRNHAKEAAAAAEAYQQQNTESK